MSLKLISRGAAAVLLTAGIASAQLMNSKSLDVIRVEKTGISGGKIDSLATMLGQQQAPGQKLTDEMMTQLRYAVVDNLVGQELIKLEAKKMGIKVSAGKVDSLTALFKKQFPSEDAFQKELKKSNTTMAQFKSKIEDQLKSEQILEKKVSRLSGSSTSPRLLSTIPLAVLVFSSLPRVRALRKSAMPRTC